MITNPFLPPLPCFILPHSCAVSPNPVKAAPNFAPRPLILGLHRSRWPPLTSPPPLPTSLQKYCKGLTKTSTPLKCSCFATCIASLIPFQSCCTTCLLPSSPPPPPPPPPVDAGPSLGDCKVNFDTLGEAEGDELGVVCCTLARAMTEDVLFDKCFW